MANQYRGEVDFNFEGKEYSMRPTFHALCEIENEIGKPIMALLMKMPEDGILLKDQKSIIKAGIKAAGHKELENLDEIIQKLGSQKILSVICKFLANGLGL